MRPLRVLPALPLLLALVAGAAAGERTYRWVDEKGRVHYSDMPNPRGERVQVSPGSRVQATPKDGAESLAARQLECQRKKDQLTVYSSSAEITETDSLGRTRSYTADEKVQLLERTRQQMTETCTAAGMAPVATEGSGAP
jgi:hypothetical protein